MSTRFALACSVVLAGAGWYAWHSMQQPPAAPSPPASLPSESPPATTATTLRYAAPPVTRMPAPEDRRRMVALPNGDFVPALNGVLDAPAMQWPPDVPFSPIVATERDGNGVDWYVHADDTRSTTRMVFRSDTQRMDAATSVARPRPSAAILEEERR